MDENIEQKYELLVDNLLDIIVELDLNGNLIFISPQSIDITGYHHDEIIGTSIYQCIHPNDISILKNAIENAKIDKNHISLEFRVRHKNGNYIYLAAKGRLVDIDGKQKIIVLASEFSKNKGKLKESKKMLNKIIDQTFMGFAILQDFEVKFLNPKFSEVIGYSYEEIMNWKSKEVFKIIHPQDREEFISLAQEVYLGNNDALNSFQFRVLKKSGVPIWLEIQTKPINYKGNKADLIFLQDVTSSKEAEQKLIESEEQYRNLISNLTDIILKIDLKGVVTYVSPQCYDIMGYQPSELIGKNCFDYICSEDWPKIAENMKYALKTKDILSVEYRLLHKNGNKILISGNGRYTNFNGNEGFIVTIRDITIHKEIEDKLKESEERYRLITEHANDLIDVLDEKLRYEYINEETHKRVLGYSKEDMIGKFAGKFVHPDDMEDIVKKLRDGFEKGIGMTECRIKKKDGTYIWYESKGNVFMDKHGNRKALIMSRDITERRLGVSIRKEASEKLKEKNIELSVLNRIITIGNESTNLKEFLEKSYDQVLDIVGFDRGGVYLYNYETQHNFLVHHKNVHEEFLAAVEDVDISAGLFSTVFDKNKPFYIEDFSVFMENSKELGVYSAVIIPLRSKDKYLGSLNIASPIHQVLSDNELELLVAIGKQMGIIIQKFESERSLKESEENYRILFENSIEGIWVIDSNMKTSFINPSMADMIGYHVREILGKDILNFVSKSEKNDILNAIEKRKKGITEEIERTFIHKDGKEVYTRVRASPLIDPNGNFKGAMAFIEDITEKKTIELKLKESEEKFRTITEQSLLGIAIVQDDAFKYVNQRFADIAGYSIAEMKNRTKKDFGKLIHPEDRAMAVEQARKKQSGIENAITHYQHRAINKDGKIVWIDNYSKNIIFDGKSADLITLLDITDKINAEQKLKESEEKYRQLFKILPLSLILISREGIYVDCNTGTEKLFGYKREDLIGKDFRRLPIIPTNNVPLFEERLEFLFKGEILEPAVFEALRKNGESLWVNSHASLVKIRNKNLALIIGQDITNERRAAYKIKESEEKYRHLFEKSPFSIILFDSEGIIKDCNSVTEEMFGFKKEEFLGKNYFHNTSINFDHLPITKKIFEQLKEGESLLPQEIKIFRADGTSIWINSQISKVKIINQPYFYSIIQDITNKKILEDIMFELNQNFFNFTTDFQENIQSLTQTAKKLSKGTLVLYAKKGFQEEGSTVQIISSSNGLINCDFTDFKQKYFINEIFNLKHETPQIFQNLNSRDYTMEDPFIQKYCLKGAYGKIIKNTDDFTSVISIFYENTPEISYEEQLVLLLISDAIAIEEKRWQLLEKLEEQNAKLSEIDKLKSEFLRRISHELKTPLISIKGFSQLLLYNNKRNFDNDTLSMIEEITRGCVRLENLISELIESSKLESAQVKLKLKFEDLALLINNSVNELQGVAKTRNQEIILNIHKKLITKFEKERMHEVIGNLLTNAIKYSPPSNSIVIKSEIKDGFYVISVKDNGIGFTPEEKRKLFNQFGKIYRFDQETNLAAEGSGLGLYITKKLLELHGGKIWVESEGRDKGSTFYFTLPIIKE